MKTPDEAVSRARAIAALARSVYVLGAGGRNPDADNPFTIRDGTLGSDCIGFVLWCMGIDRYQPGKFDLYDGWINTDSMLDDAHRGAKSTWFDHVDKPFPGCAVVFPSTWDDRGRMTRMGHIGLVTRVPDVWPDDIFALSYSARTKLLSQVEVIDCNASFSRRIRSHAVDITSAAWAWNKWDAWFVQLKTERVSPVSTSKLGSRLLALQNPLMSGSDVLELQEKLGVSPDGVFGADTDNALRAFQKAQAITVDGVCGSETLAALAKVAARASAR